jgi:hypothetical protein
MMEVGEVKFRMKNGLEIPAEVESFLKMTLEGNPEKRMNWKTLKNHFIFRLGEVLPKNSINDKTVHI